MRGTRGQVRAAAEAEARSDATDPAQAQSDARQALSDIRNIYSEHSITNQIAQLHLHNPINILPPTIPLTIPNSPLPLGGSHPWYEGESSEIDIPLPMALATTLPASATAADPISPQPSTLDPQPSTISPQPPAQIAQLPGTSTRQFCGTLPALRPPSALQPSPTPLKPWSGQSGMRLALGSSQRPLLNTPPSRVAVSEDAEDNAYPPLSPLQRSSATPSQPPVHSPLQEFITPRETFTGATATQAASPPHMTTNNLFSSEEEVESPSKRLARTPRQLPEPTPVNQLPASQPSGNRSSSSSDNSGSRPSQSPHGPWGNPGGDPASSSDSDGVPDDEADTGGPPGQPEDQPPSPPDSDDEPPPPPEEDEVPPPPNFQGDVSDADSNDSERHVALMISVGSVLSWQLPTEGSQLHGGSVSHTKAWLLMMKSYIVNIKRDLAVEELWEQMMVQVYENSQPFVLFTDNRAAWIQECNALQTQSSLNGVLQVNEHGQPIMNPATWKLKLIHFYELVKTGLALALKVTPLDAKEEYEKFDCYDNAGLLYPMPRILMSEFTKKYEEFDIRAGQPHYREAMAKVAKLLDRMAPTLKENFGSYKDVTPLGCWAIAKLYKLDQDQHTLERLSGIAQTEASKRDDMTAQGMLLCVSKPPTQRPTVMPRQTPAFPVTQDPSAPKGNNGEPKSSTVCTTCNITGHGSDTCYLNNPGTPNPSWCPKNPARYAIWRTSTIQQGFAPPPTLDQLKSGVPYFRSVQGAVQHSPHTQMRNPPAQHYRQPQTPVQQQSSLPPQNPRYKGKNPRPFSAGTPGNNNQRSMGGTGGGYQDGYQGKNQGTQGGYQTSYQGNNQGTQGNYQGQTRSANDNSMQQHQRPDVVMQLQQQQHNRQMQLQQQQHNQQLHDTVFAIREELRSQNISGRHAPHPHDQHSRSNQPLQLEAPQAAQSDLPEPDWYNAALVVSFRQTPDAETQASSQAIYKPTFDPSTDGTGSTAAIPLPSARVSRHVTQAQHRASQDLLMDEMTVLQRDLDLMFREVQNLHEFNRALQVRATAVETAQRAACVTHNPVDTFVRDYTASGQLSPSTATLLQGTEPSYGVPYLANLSHQTGLSFKSTTGLLQCVNLMVLVDTGSGLNFISQSMADSLGHDPLPCHHKTIAFNDVKSSLTKEIQMPVIFCSETPNEISVRATFVIAPDNTIFDALIGTPLMAMPGISALPDISQEKLTLRPFLHLSSAEHTATGRALTVDLPFRPVSRTKQLPPR